MNLFQLECFLAVADYLNFARASERMNISQPAVTHQIQVLENELGVKLFRRSTRSVELTAEGLAFLDDARNIVGLSKRAIKRFEHSDEQDITDFSIGCTSQVQYAILPEVIRKLIKLHPALHPRILSVPGTQILKRVEEGSIDVALGLRMDMKKSFLAYRELKRVPPVCVFREDHPLASKSQVTTEDIKQHKLILYHPPGSAPQEVIQLQARLTAEKKPSELYFCPSVEAAMVLAGAGLGISILSDILVPDELGGASLFHLEKRRIMDVGERSFGCYYRTLKGNALLQDFLRLLKEEHLTVPQS